MDEEWLPVPGYLKYEASSLGRVRRSGGKVLSSFFRGTRYLWVTLYNEEGKKPRAVHQMVCLAFHGQRPDGALALHNNDIPTDNRVDNLYWGTHQQNSDDALRNGGRALSSMKQKGQRRPEVQGERQWKAKLNEDLVRQIRKMHASGMTCGKIANIMPVNKSNIEFIVARVTWKHVT